MSPPKPSVGAIFDAALQLPREQRNAHVHAACAGDDALRQRVQALLAAHESAGSFMEEPAAAPRPGPPGEPYLGETRPSGTIKTAAEPADEAVGQTIGRYKLRQKIGEGGCGVVYAAEQTEPVRRKVAIKVIKLGMDTQQVIARFEAERQALAMMDHPNIAKVLDGGTTETGRPYFAMELVRGIRITDYCDQNKLGTKDRLALFTLVCQAIQHAHQKGVIHRDIKPSNILVTLHDGVPVPKVIDFGIAKAIEGRLTDSTVFTQLHQFMGTPAYMSPEQAEMSGLDIDTRSDIYSLGVLLYELLAGTTPFDAKQLAAAGVDAMRTMIREQEPVRPSTRLGTMVGTTSTTIAQQRSTDVLKLAHQIRGDLDWIVMKCLEKDRTRRYETANGLAADIKRYLSDEPVTAGPPSKGYVVRKFVRRNRGMVLAGAAVVAVLLLGIAGTTWGLVEARRQSGQAKQRLTRITKANEILTSIFEGLDPESVARSGRTVQAILSDKLVGAAAEIEKESIGDPIVIAETQASFANSLLSMGDTKRAIALHEKALASIRRGGGGFSGPLWYALRTLGRAYMADGRWDSAVGVLEEELKLRRTQGEVMTNSTAGTFQCLRELGDAHLKAGRRELGLSVYDQALELARATADSNPSNTDSIVSEMRYLAHKYADGGKPDLAVQVLEEALTRWRKLHGPDYPRPPTFILMDDLARGYDNSGKLERGFRLHEEALKFARANLGADHTQTIIGMLALAEAHARGGKPELAVPLYEDTVKLARTKHGMGSSITFHALSGLASQYETLNKTDLALPLLEEAWQQGKVRYGDDSPETLMILQRLDTAYEAAGRFDDSIRVLQQAVRIGSPKDRGNEFLWLGRDLLLGQRFAEAVPALRSALQARPEGGPEALWLAVGEAEEAAGKSPTNGANLSTILAWARLGYQSRANEEWSYPPVLPAMLTRAEAETRKMLEQDPGLAEAWQALATLQWLRQLPAEALVSLDLARALRAEAGDSLELRGDILVDDNRPEQALEVYERCLATLTATHAAPRLMRGRALRKHAAVCRVLGRWPEAAADVQSLLGVPARDPGAGAQLVDLSAFYNGALTGWTNVTFRDFGQPLASLPTGIHVLAGARFDVRGVIQLRNGRQLTHPYPDRMAAIPVKGKAARLRFLQGLVHGGDAVEAPFAKYVIHYADGSALERPLVLGRDALDWASEPQGSGQGNAVVAWSGSCPEKRTVRLYLVTWENPHPDKEIASLDFVSAQDSAAPFLVAVTVE